ncbi:MAG TPA: electron transfer flavoprotein subunit alpha [Candidatus Cloacimonadota bacterium]|nr:electron transfer flavoprotein subunit alpha [Candidatus Cloacimonadota bacterium]HPT72685.1 electron transfer flavoprotein subunit alpha [Candidatus Cloacimonadota bacterium]
MIEVIVDKCVGCGLCVKACAYDAITITNKVAEINTDKCVLCGACVSACKFEAIMIRKTTKQILNKEDFSGVWVYAEQHHGAIAPVTLELLGKGRELADELEVELSAVLLGSEVEPLSSELIAFGADKVIVVDDPALLHYTEERYAYALTEISRKFNPEIILAGATATGRSFIPRVAVTLRTGLTADCTGLKIDTETRNLQQTRPAFGGNIMATIITPNHRPQMATVRHKVMNPSERDPNRSGIVLMETIDFPEEWKGSEYLDFVKEESNLINIVEANIIVSGGRGLKDASNFKLLEDLAASLGGAVGASRAAVDSEWIPYSHQVGQTGKTVKPRIYIACGISGAVQHLAGMQSSDYIIAINRDPDAAIFKAADLGIVGDLFEIVPKLTKRINEVRL